MSYNSAMRTSILSAGVLSLAIAAFAPLSAQAPSERKLQVTFDQLGNVTVVAQNVTIAEILAEWSRQGGTAMVNANRLSGPPVSRYHLNEPEVDVISSLLRQAAGYIVTPRRQGVPGASRFEVVQITPTSVTNSTAFTPVPNAPVSAPVTTPGSPNDELPPIVPPGAANPPPPAAAQPPPGPAPGAYPGSVAVPVVPVVPVPGGRTGGAPVTPPPGGRGGGGL